ncbi:MAG: sigma-70 family RNA polymerase sigma factor [Rikenellaceae bacterium]|nr:sigma-70 family RNA polymerase sigma factor [Rikenellaceae bacterium]
MKMKDSEKEFAQLVREHKTTIYTVCYMFSKDKDEVEELFQEVLIALWRGFNGFRGECNIRSWIYRVSLNTCISAERKKRRRADSVRLDMNINLFSDTDEDSRQSQMLRKRIGKLGVFDRAIILLWLENLSYEEIGAIVGITAKNVSVRLVRIREQLKNMSND